MAQTEAALANAQQAQQQAVYAQQGALAEEHHSLMQLRNDLQQQPGQRALCLRHTAYFRRHAGHHVNASVFLLHINNKQWQGTNQSIHTPGVCMRKGRTNNMAQCRLDGVMTQVLSA